MDECIFNPKNGKEFDEEDPFNGNQVKGILNMGGKSKYGSLWITEVNGEPAPQFIQGTPKLSYPYTQGGDYDFGKVEEVEVYEKLDGTNILQFDYRDAHGDLYQSFKTRRMPFLSRDFLVMWQEILDRYPGIWGSKMPGVNIAYELYGIRNHHSVRYDVDLDARVVFYVTHIPEGNHTVTYAPSDGMRYTRSYAPRPVPLVTEITGQDDITREYERLRQYMEERNTVEGEDMEDMEIEGIEGMVLDVRHPRQDGVSLYKCKPDCILDFHWAGSGIPNHSIRTTVINAFEEAEEPDFELVKELLREEFLIEDIERKRRTIEKMTASVRADRILANKVLPEYDRMQELDSTFDIDLDRGKVMRHFAQVMGKWGLSKRNAGKIFTIISRARGSYHKGGEIDG